jgi:glycosyltransferase involved in cell wall biosynthesis
MAAGKKLFIVVNVDWFFLSHRLPIALAAKKNGYDVTIVSSDTGKSAEIRSYGLKFIEAPFTRSGTNIVQELSIIRFLKKLYRLHKPDVIHHVTLKPSIYGSIAAGKAGIKNVVNAISGLGYNFTVNRKGIKQFILNSLLKRSLKSERLQFIFQNPDDVRTLEDIGLIKSKRQIHIIKGSGVDLDGFPFSTVLPGDKIKILLPARMLYDKGIVEFIQAARLLKDKFSNSVCFNLAGDIDLHNPAAITEEELAKLLEPPYINWIGFQKMMSRVLAEHDIVVLPSYREGLPKSLVEACAIGRPIVTTDAPGCRECINENYNGFLVPVKDHIVLAQRIERLIVDPELRANMGRNSRAYAEENFSIENVIRQTLDIYSQLLTQPL